jgi:hypothetical protein
MNDNKEEIRRGIDNHLIEVETNYTLIGRMGKQVHLFFYMHSINSQTTFCIKFQVQDLNHCNTSLKVFSHNVFWI